jgi:predicted RNA binding protein YcfA (HicA-like mRNA interferase family)
MPFRDFERLIRAFGFVEQRQRGSHRSFRHPDCPKLLTIQPRAAQAKPYQIKEFLAMVLEFGLEQHEP